MHDLISLVDKISGATFASMDTIVQVQLKGGQSNPMQGRVTKTMNGSQIMLFQNKNKNGYDAMVRRRLEAEGKDPDSFKLSPRQWGERLPNLPIVSHTKKGETEVNYYLEAIFLKAGEIVYLLDGIPIDKDKIEGLIETREEGKQAGLEDKVIIRTFAAKSIVRFRLDGEEFLGPFTCQ